MVDTEATKHVYSDRSVIITYIQTREEEVIYLRDSRTLVVVGKGTVQLKLTSRKVLPLSDVLHVKKISCNLVSGSLLNKVK